MHSYWSTQLTRRLSRRRALAATGAAGTAAAILAACGGGDDGGRSEKSSAVTEPVDTTKQAKRSGVMKDRTFADPPSLDVFTANNPWNSVGPMVYSTLVQIKPGYLKPPQNDIGADLAESWEWAPDGLSIVLKLRQGVKWHNKPPVNARAFDMDDVLFSWERFTTRSSSRSGIANSANPQAPVLSLTATDPRTLVIKLKEPLVYALALFSSNSSGQVNIVPKETDTSLDIRNDMIGTGPFVLTSYTPSAGFVLKRDPNHWDKDAALVEQIDLPIVPEYTSALAQLKAGNIYSMGSYRSTPQVTPEDILPVKQEAPQVQVYQGDIDENRNFGSRVMSFGWLPEGRSPFVDERVRQAVSLGYDRDLYQNVVLNVTRFESEGMPVIRRWNTHLAATSEGWWLDPQGKDFGPNAKFFKHDVAEAKRLLSAAGFPNGFETVSSYVTSGELPTAKHAEIIDGFMTEIGLKSRVNGLDYATQYIRQYRDGNGQYEGWAYMSTAGAPTGGDAVGALANQFWSRGGAPSFHGFSISGKNDKSGDPQVDAMIEKARVELDTEKRRALVFDIQRYLAKPVYSLLPPGPGTGFTVAWPCIGNFRVYQMARLNHALWVDDTKPPFKPA